MSIVKSKPLFPGWSEDEVFVWKEEDFYHRTFLYQNGEFGDWAIFIVYVNIASDFTPNFCLKLTILTKLTLRRNWNWNLFEDLPFQRFYRTSLNEGYFRDLKLFKIFYDAPFNRFTVALRKSKNFNKDNFCYILTYTHFIPA